MEDTEEEQYRGMQALACAVLERALEDAQMADEGRPSHRHETAQARIFLTAPTGQWAKARALWCDRAGFDPAAFHDRVQRVLA